MAACWVSWSISMVSVKKLDKWRSLCKNCRNSVTIASQNDSKVKSFCFPYKKNVLYIFILYSNNKMPK